MAKRVCALLAAVICVAVLVDVERAPERPLSSAAVPRRPEYASSARSLAHDKGFYTYIYHGSRQPPRYPPGYPMALVPFAAIGSYPRDVQRGAKFWAMLYVLVAVIAAWVLGGPARCDPHGPVHRRVTFRPGLCRSRPVGRLHRHAHGFDAPTSSTRDPIRHAPGGRRNRTCDCCSPDGGRQLCGPARRIAAPLLQRAGGFCIAITDRTRATTVGHVR